MIREKVLETTEYVVRKSKKVRINGEKIKKLAEHLKNAKLSSLDKDYHFLGGEKETIQYLFVIDSLNFSFFPDKRKRKWVINYKGKQISGYLALASAFKKALSEYPLLDAEFLSSISLKTLKEILKGRGEAPLLEKRWKILRENSKILLDSFEGEAINLVRNSEKSCQRLVQILLDKFPSFRDISFYKGKRIYFLKRAQIFAADIYKALEGRGEGDFFDIEALERN